MSSPGGPEQQPYQPYGQPSPYAFTPKPPALSSATTSMVLGLIGLVGIIFCAGLTLVFSPFAWFIGAKAVREIDSSPLDYSGREMAVAGKIMGIIGTVLLILGVVVLVAFVAWAISLDNNDFE